MSDTHGQNTFLSATFVANTAPSSSSPTPPAVNSTKHVVSRCCLSTPSLSSMRRKKNSPRGAPQIKKLERASLEQIALKSRLTLGTTTLAEKRQRPFPSANKTQPKRAEERNAWKGCMVGCAVPRSTGSRRVRRLEERGVQLYEMFGTGLRPTGLRKAASFQIREVILEQRPRRCPCFAAGNPAQLSFHERRCAEFGDWLCRVDFPQHACALYPTPPEAKGHRLIPTCLPLDTPPNTTSGSVSGSSSSLSNSIQLLYPSM